MSIYSDSMCCVHHPKFGIGSYCVLFFSEWVSADTTHEICRHPWLCCWTDICTVDLIPTSERFAPCSLVFFVPYRLREMGQRAPPRAGGSECLWIRPLQERNAEVQTALTAESGSWVTMPWRNMKTCWQKSNRSRKACATATPRCILRLCWGVACRILARHFLF